MFEKLFNEVRKNSPDETGFAIRFDDKYFGIREYDSNDIPDINSWDYYYADNNFNIIESGVLDGPYDGSYLPLEDAVKELFDWYNIEPVSYEFIDTDWYFDKVM